MLARRQGRAGGVVVQTVQGAASLSSGGWVASVAGVLVGTIISYLSALPDRVVFDAARDKVAWRHIGWPGGGHGGCPIADVVGVEVLADHAGAKRLALTTRSGMVPLTRYLTGFERHEQRERSKSGARGTFHD